MTTTPPADAAKLALIDDFMLEEIMNDDDVELLDTFRGDNAVLIRNIEALIYFNDAGAIVPHGIGGHARSLLSAAAVRLAAQASQIEALTGERDEALVDVRIWKGEAETRSEGLVQLNLDRADLSVRAMIATERATAAEAKAAKMREALTPDGDTKAAYIGEIKFMNTEWDEEGEERTVQRTLDWDTTKAVMKMILEYAVLDREYRP